MKLHQLGIVACVVFTLAITHANAAGNFADEVMRIDPASRATLQRAVGVLEVVPVILPEGENRLGVNDHFGWPVATMAGDAIIVVFHRRPGHWGETDKPDQDTSTAVVLRSTDGGKTWSKPFDFKSLVRTPTVECRLGFGNSIGVDKDGAVVVVTGYGVFRSEDRGATWTHLPGAFGQEQLPGPRTNNGPRLLTHPTYGLVALGHIGKSGSGDAKRNRDGTPYVPPELWVRWSTDGGRHWSETKQDLPPFAAAVEPTGLFHNGAMFVVARCHGSESYEPETHTWRYVQLVSDKGWLPLGPALTTIRASDVRDKSKSKYHGPWTQDTVDLSYNPVSKRIECAATDRNGSAASAQNGRDCQTLNLWSIDPNELAKGSAVWQFEATLLKRTGIMVAGESDGMHPGAAVIDEKAGVQHIFIYAGSAKGPAGIFRVTRTLNTADLKRIVSGQ